MSGVKQEVSPEKPRKGGNKICRINFTSPGNGGFVLVMKEGFDHELYMSCLAKRNTTIREFSYDAEHGTIFTPGDGKENHEDAELAFKLVCMGPAIACDTSVQSPPDTVAKGIPLNNTAKILDRLVSPPDGAMKHKTLSFSCHDVNELKRKFGGEPRKPNQEQAMCRFEKGGVPARLVAVAHGHEHKKRQWEWTHLIGHRFFGPKGQTDDNMVLATKECNTLMMFVESEVARLLKHEDMDEDDEATLDVTAYCDKGTHRLDKMTYRIQVPRLEFDLTLTFYGLMRYQPQANMEDYYGALFDYMLLTKQPLAFVETPTPMKKKEHVEVETKQANFTPMVGDPSAFDAIFAKEAAGEDVPINKVLFQDADDGDLDNELLSEGLVTNEFTK